MLFKLAARNVRRQIGSYIIYFITVSLTIALIFAINNMLYSDVMGQLTIRFGDIARMSLMFVTFILCIIMAFVLSYATNFLLRKRKKEFGLYLTLGMSRGNVLAVFAGETAITFLVSLAVGILIGLAVYQAVMVIFINFIGFDYAPAGYSGAGFLWTIVMVAGMFVLSSVASLGYLRFARITTLLQGGKKAEKDIRIPFVWLVVFLLSVAGLVVSAIMFIDWMQLPDFWAHFGSLAAILVALFASMFFLPLSLTKVVFWLILKRNCCAFGGTGRFTARQLSSRLSSNAVMTGAVSLLLAVAIVGPNIFMSMTGSINNDIDNLYLYDISCETYPSIDIGGEYPETGADYYANTLEYIEEYADIRAYADIWIYNRELPSVEGDEYYAENRYEYFIAESQFRALCALLGYQLPDLNGGYIECTMADYYDERTFGYTPMQGSQGECVGRLVCPYEIIDFNVSEWKVVPDEQTNEYHKYLRMLAVMLESSDYDAITLREILYESGIGNFDVKENERMANISQLGLFLLGDMYISVVFVLLSIAILALKILSMVSDDRKYYRELWRLGASEGSLMRSLVVQMLFLFLMPFLVPLLLNFPLYSAIKILFGQSVNFSGVAVALQLAGFSAFILAVFAVYFVASCVVAWRDIRKNIRVSDS